MQEQVSIKTQVIRYLTWILLAGVILGGLLLAWPTYRRSQSLKAQVADLDAQIAAKKAEIAELKEKQRRFATDPEFIESIARQNRRVYPGELIFIFNDRK